MLGAGRRQLVLDARRGPGGMLPRALGLVLCGVLVLVLVLVLFASPDSAAQEASASDDSSSDAPVSQTFEDQEAVTVVEVPVQVLENGVPVRGLTAEDFEIWDGEERRPLLSFEVVDRSEGAALMADPAADSSGGEPRSGPAAARRHFLLLFDLSFTELQGLKRAEQGARDLITRGLHPQDLVAVAFYSDRQGLALPLAFTSDRRQALRVLDALALLLQGDRVSTGEEPEEGSAEEAAGAAGAAEVAASGAVSAEIAATEPARGEPSEPNAAAERPPVRDPLRLTLGSWDVTMADLGEAAGRGRNPILESLLEGFPGSPVTLVDSFRQYEDSHRQRRRAQVRTMALTLQALVDQLQGIDGAKHLVLFSGGFPSYVYGANLIRMDQGVSQTLSVLEETVEKFRRAGWSIQAVEPQTAQGFIAGEGDGTGGLFFLSEETGGGLYSNLNEVSSAMERMLERTSVTYLLAFQTPPVPADGSFRPIEVRLTERRRGVDLVHRSGYHTPTPYLERSGEARRWETAQAVLAGRGKDELGLAVMAAPFRDSEGVERVPVVLEVDGERILEGYQPGGDAPLGFEVYAYALSADGYGDGEIRDFFVRSVALDPEQATEALAAGGLKFYGDLSLPPGRYLLRLLVRALPSGRESVQGLELEIPDLWGRHTVLLPPVFLQGRGERWLLVREEGAEERPYPFVFQGQEFVPAALSRLELPDDAPTDAAPAGDVPANDADPGRLLLMGYNLGDGELDFEVRILDEAGREMEAGRLAFVARAEGEGTIPDAIAVTLDPVGLDPGDYRLAFDLVDPETGERRSTATRFRVRPAAREVAAGEGSAGLGEGAGE